MQGWIKLHRCIRSHWIWDNPQYLKCWLDMLMQAGYTSRKILVNGTLRETEPGEFLTSEVKLAQRWQLNRKTVRSILALFEKDGMIVLTKSRKEGTWIKIANYRQYQHESEVFADKEEDNRQDNSRDSGGDISAHKSVPTVVYINNNFKKDRKEEVNPSMLQADPEDKQAYLERYDTDFLGLIAQAMGIFAKHHGPLTKEREVQMYRNWAALPSERVRYGLNKYINTPGIHNKNEQYILGIMKNASYAEIYVMMREAGM